MKHLHIWCACVIQKTKRDGTITTAGSSMYSTSYHGTPAYQKSPGQLVNILVLPPGTEMGEI